MIKSNFPKKLWDDCLELEMEISSCNANNVFELKGEVPRTVMKGETANRVILTCYRPSEPNPLLPVQRHLGTLIESIEEKE